jgi:rubrerythrin
MKEQIEEMARIIDDNHGFIVSSVETAEALYNAGYRKQKEGEWAYEYTGNCLEGTDAPLDYKCSLCGEFATDQFGFCPNCGAHMKGE